MEINEKKDLYKSYLKRELVYVVFLASGETDLSLLPEPATMAERGLMKLCRDKVAAMKAAAKLPADSEHPEGHTDTGESSQSAQPEEEKSATKKPAAKRTASKKASSK